MAIRQYVITYKPAGQDNAVVHDPHQPGGDNYSPIYPSLDRAEEAVNDLRAEGTRGTDFQVWVLAPGANVQNGYAVFGLAQPTVAE